MDANPSLWLTSGLSSGEVIQFAEGRWNEVVGDGVGLNEATFDLVEPHLQASCVEWTPQHRYGVFELPWECVRELADVLQHEALSGSDKSKGLIFSPLSEWLDRHAAAGLVVSVLGL